MTLKLASQEFSEHLAEAEKRVTTVPLRAGLCVGP